MGLKGKAHSRPLILAPLTPLPCDPYVFSAPLSLVFHRRVTVQAVEVDLEQAYDLDRDQYHSTDLLGQLADHAPQDADCVAALADIDLYVPVLTYVFGEAQLGGRLAIVSTFRLREPWRERGASEGLVQRRIMKTLMHELGHTVGLRHCRKPSCVMTFATNLEMLDEKGDGFCLDCRAEITRAQQAS